MATGSIKMSNKFHRLHGRYIMYHEATCSYLENNKGVVGSLLFIIDNVNYLNISAEIFREELLEELFCC